MEVNKQEIYKFVIDKINTKSRSMNFSFENIRGDFNLIESRVFDSMDFFNLIVEIENKFGVTIDFSDADPNYFTTINGLVECVT